MCQYTSVECRWMGKNLRPHSSLGDGVGEIDAGSNSYTVSKSAYTRDEGTIEKRISLVTLGGGKDGSTVFL